MTSISTVADLINYCGGVEKLASGLDVSLYTVVDWKSSGRIPPKHWTNISIKFDVPAAVLINLSR